MPGLIRGVARTAAIAGTATAVSNRVSRRQAGRWAAQDAQPAQQAYVAPPPAPVAPVAPTPVAAAPSVDFDTRMAQLKELGELRDSGVLTVAEFDEQKARILNS